jgi:hypothetical protein
LAGAARGEQVEADLLYQSVFLAGVNIVLAVAIIAMNWWAASGRPPRRA